MNDFDEAFAVEADVAQEVMGEMLRINGVEDVPGVVPVQDFTTALSPTIGGKTQQPGFEVYLTLAAVAKCQVQKGHLVERPLKGIRGRVMQVQDLGGAGVMLTCGPEQTRDV
jgi:hypothetical protein